MSDDASQHTRACSRNRSHKRWAQVAEHLFGWQLVVAVIMFSSCSLCFSFDRKDSSHLLSNLVQRSIRLMHRQRVKRQLLLASVHHHHHHWCLLLNLNRSLLSATHTSVNRYGSTCPLHQKAAMPSNGGRADELMDIRWLDFLNDVFHWYCLLHEPIRTVTSRDVRSTTRWRHNRNKQESIHLETKINQEWLAIYLSDDEDVVVLFLFLCFIAGYVPWGAFNSDVIHWRGKRRRTTATKGFLFNVQFEILQEITVRE